MYLEIQNLSKTISKNPILRNITIGMEAWENLWPARKKTVLEKPC